MVESRIALVTGANRGIGFEICRQLAQKGIKVVLTARNEQKGRGATESLRERGLDVVFHQMDVTDEESVRQAAEYVKEKFGRLDILINNAGIGLDWDYRGLNADIEKIKETMETNTYGPLRVCQALIPLMQENNQGRVINISSGMGALHQMTSRSPGYNISKAALNAVTRILAHELRRTKISINSVAPGWVRTSMSGPEAPDSVEEGADTAVWLATCDDSFTGKFFDKRKEIDW